MRKKTVIIGHRGAAGLALENTMASFRKAVAVGVRTIEFDIHATSDGHFVVCHDEYLGRVSNSDDLIASLTYEELRHITLHNGEHVPLLEEVLELARKQNIAVIAEVKGVNPSSLEVLCELLDTYSDLDMVVASFNHDAIAAMKKLRPHYRFYLAENNHPIEALRKARFLGLQGIDLNYALLNPLTYWLAKHWRLEIMVYTVDWPFAVWFIGTFYPGVAICTNHPEHFVHKSREK